MTLVQILIIGFAILVLIKTTSDFKKKRIALRPFLFWIVLWLIIITVAMLPWVTGPLAKILGVGRGTDIAVYVSILLIFLTIFKVFSELEKIKREITEIVQHLSLKNPRKK